MKTSISTIALISCLLPLAIFAAPSEADIKRASTVATDYEDLPVKVSPKESCASQGASFSSLGSADAIAKTVAHGCGDYADDPHHIVTFIIGQSVRTLPFSPPLPLSNVPLRDIPPPPLVSTTHTHSDR